ncbi:hypothetical protein BJ508DRAFT_375273 [Ascobolus immersus RN42]|uniref:Uncharacterized protein n=1 Tax=Ascobolus immersus RN42 TaxID=1160509 RepID=A0A3N4IN79_ASCIM|nr:hypothetical protein BJ508DRAFT_375273 [Ascobolus immersus RN42]
MPISSQNSSALLFFFFSKSKSHFLAHRSDPQTTNFKTFLSQPFKHKATMTGKKEIEVKAAEAGAAEKAIVRLETNDAVKKTVVHHGLKAEEENAVKAAVRDEVKKEKVVVKTIGKDVGFVEDLVRPISISIASSGSSGSVKAQKAQARKRAQSMVFKTMGGKEIIHTGSSRPSSSTAMRKDALTESVAAGEKAVAAEGAVDRDHAGQQGVSSLDGSNDEKEEEDEEVVGVEKSGEEEEDDVGDISFSKLDPGSDDDDDDEAVYIDLIDAFYGAEDGDRYKNLKGSVRRKSVGSKGSK